MIYVLLGVIIVILINQNNLLNKKIKEVNDNLSVLYKKLDQLKIPVSTISQEVKKATPEVNPENLVRPAISEEVKPPTPVKSPTPEEIPTKESLTDAVTEKAKAESPILDIKAPNRNITPESIKKPKEKKPSLWDSFKEKNPDLEKFIGENLINKIGILILVLGISYFVKYAIDKDWINEPGRVGIGILAGSLVLAIAHRLRKKYASFSSVLVAGAIAIFYFTIAIAFHEYKLFNQTIAFIIMVLITAFSCLLSLSYNRIELAILSLIGGFAVPFMISTGSGNYQVLFSYIAILNIGILAIAYFKKWSLVNILAFIFTTILFLGWLTKVTLDDSTDYFGGLMFAFIFYIIFIAATVVNNIRTKGEFTKTELGLLAANNAVFFGIGMTILSKYHTEFRGAFTAMMSILNLIYAWFLYKKFGLDKKAVYLLIGLTLSFITLAIPIQFKGNYITLCWAVEAVLLLWLAQKSDIKTYRFASVIVQVLMLGSLFIDWGELNIFEPLPIILNPIFITGIFCAGSLFATIYLTRNETTHLSLFKLNISTASYRYIASIVALIVLYVSGYVEINHQAYSYTEFSTTRTSILFLYHLIFTAILAIIVFKKKLFLNLKVVSGIAIFNILIYVLFFLNLPFKELEETIVKGIDYKTSFYIHYFNLALILFFGWLLYTINKTKSEFKFFSNKATIWLAALLVVIIFSNETLIHGLQFNNLEVTDAQLSEIDLPKDQILSDYRHKSLVKDNIKEASLKVIKTGIPVLWGILSFIFLIAGIKRKVKVLRVAALVLLGITIIKLFTYDISNVSETGKIIAFILLGVLILIISFVYQKIKVLVIDDETALDNPDKKTENHE